MGEKGEKRNDCQAASVRAAGGDGDGDSVDIGDVSIRGDICTDGRESHRSYVSDGGDSGKSVPSANNENEHIGGAAAPAAAPDMISAVGSYRCNQIMLSNRNSEVTLPAPTLASASSPAPAVGVNFEVKNNDELKFLRKFGSLLFCAKGISINAKAVRILEILEESFTCMWILAKHLALMVELFKELGYTRRTRNFGTYRVELCVVLHPRVADPHNFDLVLRLLEPEEVGCLLCRVGWLNLFNPMKPEGSYDLDLMIPEERVVAKMLVGL